MNNPSIEERLAALQARRSESAVAEPSTDLRPPTGPPVELPAPMMAALTAVAVDPVALARTHRFGRRRSYPAGRARVGVTVAAAAGFLALVPVMGPLTAAPNDDAPQPPDDEQAPGRIATSPNGSVDSTIDLTTTTTTTTTTLPSNGAAVDPAIDTTAVPAPPSVPGSPSVAAAPLSPSAPAPTPRGGAAPVAAPAAPAPAGPAPAAPGPVAPAPTPPSVPVVTAPPTAVPAPTVPAPAPTTPPTAPPTTAAPPPPPPPPTTAPPPPTTSPS